MRPLDEAFEVTASLLSSIFHCQCLLHKLYFPPTHQVQRKGGSSKIKVQCLGLGHTKEYAQLHFYIVLLRKMLLKYKVDLSHDHMVVR